MAILWTNRMEVCATAIERDNSPNTIATNEYETLWDWTLVPSFVARESFELESPGYLSAGAFVPKFALEHKNALKNVHIDF